MKIENVIGYAVFAAVMTVFFQKFNVPMLPSIMMTLLCLILSDYYNVIRGMFTKNYQWFKLVCGAISGSLSVTMAIRSIIKEDDYYMLWAPPAAVFVLAVIWGFNVSMYHYFKQKYPNQSMWRP